jgi:hypothetical protein
LTGSGKKVTSFAPSLKIKEIVMNIKAIQIANMFSLKGEAISAESFGCGHINDTFLVETDEGEKYILQQINTSVFKNPDALMTNIVSVTEFLKKKIAEILIFVNLGLHTVFVFILLWLKASIEFFALSFMISLLIYLLFSLVRYKVFCGREEKP